MCATTIMNTHEQSACNVYVVQSDRPAREHSALHTHVERANRIEFHRRIVNAKLNCECTQPCVCVYACNFVTWCVTAVSPTLRWPTLCFVLWRETLLRYAVNVVCTNVCVYTCRGADNTITLCIALVIIFQAKLPCIYVMQVFSDDVHLATFSIQFSY